MPVPIRILTVDDHPLLREGIAAVLSRHADVCVVGEAASGEEAIAAHAALRPDVTLMDLALPGIDGIEAMCAIRRAVPEARVLMLTTYRSDVQAGRALRLGAAGFLLKSLLRTELLDAIRCAARGQRWLPADLAAEVSALALQDALTEREIRVLELVAGGLTNREVGQRLALSEETIKSRLKLILGKLDARDRTHAVTIALTRGIIRLAG
uniref:response regulator n=1 Tax=Derxia lacustris TaxID=764842 RepID=UPI00111C8B8D